MVKINDFVNQCQVTNALVQLPISTAVYFKLPKDKIGEDGIEFAYGQIQSHLDGNKYGVTYKDEVLEIKYEDIVATKEQVDQMPIVDSTVSITVDPSHDDEIISAGLMLNPSATSVELRELVSRVKLSESDSVSISLKSTEEENSVKTGDMYFVLADINKQQ